MPILETFTASGFSVEAREGFGVAMDIGTTNIVLALVDLLKGTIIARHSFINPQKPFGPDVISRIDAANNGRLDELSGLIKESLGDGIKGIIKSGGVSNDEVKGITIAGNTAMIYLLLGLSCESLGAYPFKPEFKTAGVYDSGYVFKAAGLNCDVRVLPWLAAFIGGDITAGLILTRAMGKDRFLLIDLGTNGEMALYNRGELSVASAAAGPAFESDQNRGASDVISCLAGLIRDGIMDGTGLLSGESLLTQKQIRALQLAKSAIRSGLEILIKSSGLEPSDLEAVYLAGGIGQATD
ncbi:MAG: ASKHA domain-containing protein, partial [Clostridiales bacterium]|nr:ASKHA domain-containing protein [Clostridiales bacterium]